MQFEGLHSREREALRRLLESGAFSRAPNLEKILVYLCEKYFNGEGNQVKEFHIATEVLSRPETFDPKKDSIVRVEIHRLRKRLKDYYEKTPDEPVRILFPEKSYLPEFQVVAEHPISPFPADSGSTPAPVAKPRRWWMLYLAGAATLAGLAVVLFAELRSPAKTKSSTKQELVSVAPVHEESLNAESVMPVTEGATPQSSANEVRILAGRPPGRYVDRYGEAWDGDRFFKGGDAVNVNAEIRTAGWDANIFAGMREGNFIYDIPLPSGYYELILLFAETAYGEGRPLGTETRRVFSVMANDKPLLTTFDVLGEAMDSNVAWIRRFKDLSPGQDGKIHLNFFRTSGTKAFVNGLILRPGAKGKMRPLRMVCRAQTFRDSNNVLWEPDHYFHGGTLITRPHGAPAGDHFQGERFGHFSYNIPVPKGKYGARLYFWEYWWGPNQPGRGGVGSRVFDVYCNHRPLVLDFDIVKRSPRDQTIIETFHGLDPDARGALVFDFVAKVNYAMLNAIEIFDESK